jgi:hypothetical protein
MLPDVKDILFLLAGMSSRDMVHRSIDGKLAPRVVNPAGQIGRNDTNVTPGRTGIGDHGNCFWPQIRARPRQQ